MDQLFTIVTHPARNLVHVMMRGFWTEEIVIAYDRAISAAGDRMVAAGCDRHEFLALVDARAAAAQMGDLIAAYRERFAPPARRPRRLATIVSSMLLKRQVERIALPNQRIFDDETEATRWLFG